MEQTAHAVGEGGDVPPHGDARDLWRAINALIDETVLQVRLDGTIFFVSRPPQGIAVDDLLGRNVVDMLDSTVRERALAWLRTAASGDAVHRRLLQVDLPDASRRWFETISVPVVRGDKVSALTIVARDLAFAADLAGDPARGRPVDLTRDAGRAQRLEMLALLAVGLVHDFNNVLAVIGSATSMLLDTVPPGDPLRPDLESIHTAIGHGSRLTRQLLELSTRRESARTRVELNEVVDSVTRMARPFLDNGVRIVTQLDPGGAAVTINRVEIEQVLLNLLLNARDAMPHGGDITVSTCRLSYTASTAPSGCRLRGSVVRLRVTDTGSGIDAATRARVFEPFFTTKSRQRGTGLGLAMVAAIVEGAEGCVELASHPGVGTTVDVVLADADRREQCAA